MHRVGEPSIGNITSDKGLSEALNTNSGDRALPKQGERTRSQKVRSEGSSNKSSAPQLQWKEE
jgi:hypothetical protein